VIVADASAVLSALVHTGPAREALGREQVHVPHLVDVELAGALRRGALAGTWPAARGSRLLKVWAELGVVRYGVQTLLPRIWQLRDNLTSYDATYVALAEALDCPLVTADGRLSRSPGLRCTITVIPR